MDPFIFPPPPEDQHCSKCGKTAVVAVNPGRPGIESECSDAACPIASDPDNQPAAGSRDGLLICFPDDESGAP